METKFNFNSQVCSSRSQSERLLTLGLKKETADMTIHVKNDGHWYITAEPFYEWEVDFNAFPCLEEPDAIIPAWSLHRLINICPYVIHTLPALHLTMTSDSVFYCTEDNNEEFEKPFSRFTNMYDNFIETIEWLINEGYFNNEYLEE